MAETIREVNPGDIITAEDWNNMAILINDHESKLEGQVSGGGTITVPSVFGTTLSDAKAILTHPTRQLVVGSVLDTTGVVVNPNATASMTRVVLNQIPSPGLRTNPGSSVNLLVAGVGDEATPPTVTISEVFPPAIPVGGTAEIRGNNFDPLPTDNSVTFDGEPVVPERNSTTTTLYVVIPTGIPGAPASPGAPQKDNVVVRVVVGTQSALGSCSIAPPSGVTRPVISGIAPPLPDGGLVGQNITITGTGFSPTPAENSVTFDSVATALTSATTTELIATIPDGIPGLTQVGNSRTDVPVIVTVNGVPSGGGPGMPPAYIYTVTRL